MPHHKSCKKRLIQAAAARIRNIANKSVLRRTLKDTRAKLAGNEEVDLKSLYSQIDKAEGKKVLHKNRAARLKSRLAKAATRTKAAAAPQA
ncbi:MAG: 30S ribosomal protein S20 [candidate division Zixibacteria bacterium]|nr:30S ribosomal protein S20 [candidate division Zixibacteria bacterium]